MPPSEQDLSRRIKKLFRQPLDELTQQLPKPRSQKLRERVTQNRRTKGVRRTEFPVKILFSVLKDGRRVFKLGGDRRPQEILSFSEYKYSDGWLSNTGGGRNDWIIGIQDENSVYHIQPSPGGKIEIVRIPGDFALALSWYGWGFWSAVAPLGNPPHYSVTSDPPGCGLIFAPIGDCTISYAVRKGIDGPLILDEQGDFEIHYSSSYISVSAQAYSYAPKVVTVVGGILDESFGSSYWNVAASLWTSDSSPGDNPPEAERGGSISHLVLPGRLATDSMLAIGDGGFPFRARYNTEPEAFVLISSEVSRAVLYGEGGGLWSRASTPGDEGGLYYNDTILEDGEKIILATILQDRSKDDFSKRYNNLVSGTANSATIYRCLQETDFGTKASPSRKEPIYVYKVQGGKISELENPLFANVASLGLEGIDENFYDIHSVSSYPGK